MEDNKEMLKESLKKISGLMYYDSTMTAIENKEIIEEQGFIDKVGNVTSNLIGGKTGTDKWKQKRNQPVTAGEITRVTRYLHNSLDGRLFNSDSRDMKNAYSQIYYLQGRKYNGADAIETVKNEYQRRYGTDLVSDIQTKLTNLDFTGAENQKNFLAVLQKGAETNTQPEIGQDTAQAVSSGGKTGWFQPCQGGVNKVGCKSNSIGQVQQMLGGLKIDNMFGPKTQEKLAQVAPEFSQQFTDADVPAIQAKLKAPVAQKIEPARIDTTKMSNPGLNPVQGDKIMEQEISSDISAEIPTLEMKTYFSRLTKKPEYINKIYNRLSAGTYKGQSALDAMKSSYTEYSGKDLPIDQKRLGLEPEVAAKDTALVNPKPIEQGYTNMAQGFVNESTISHKEMKRINKEARLNKKLGRS